MARVSRLGAVGRTRYLYVAVLDLGVVLKNSAGMRGTKCRPEIPEFVSIEISSCGGRSV